MKIIGCDLHARQQTIAMLDTDTGELEETIPNSSISSRNHCIEPVASIPARIGPDSAE